MSDSEDIECVFESMGMRGSIFISNLAAAQNLEMLKSRNIRAVLSVARSGLLSHPKEDIPDYLYIPMEDREQFEISRYFQATFEFIQKCRRETNVLIHCMVGVSRSVTIAIAYFLRKYSYTLGQVIGLIQRKRRKINPNPGFIAQLQQYSESLGIKCDFHDKKVPPIKERFLSRREKTYSLRKERTPIKIAEPLTPIHHLQRQRQVQKSFFSPLVMPLELKLNSNSRIPSIDLKKIRSFQEEQLSKKVDLKKSVSIEQKGEGSKRRRSSIQQKISKIREKMMKSGQLQKSKQMEGHLNHRQHSQNQKRKDSSSRHTCMGEQSPLKRHLYTFSSQLQRPVLSNEDSSLQRYLVQQRNKEVFSELKIQEKSFYAQSCRQNPRFSRLKEQIAR